MNSFLRLMLVFALAVSTPLFAGLFSRATDTEVDVNVDLTEEGKKIAPPSPDHPAFYFPLMAGYRELGSIVGGEKKPPALPIAKLLAKALATQGYLVTGSDKPSPSLLLVFHWGYMNPNTIETDEGNLVFNQAEMLALVGGHALAGVGTLNPSEREDVIQASRDDRYFIIVTAFDYQAATQRKKIKLWQAKMSVPSNGVDLTEVLPAMIASGGPHFGRETIRPAFTSAPIVREGKVGVGTPVVVPDATQKATGDSGKKP